MDAQGAASVAMIGLKEVVASLFVQPTQSEITHRPSNDAGVLALQVDTLSPSGLLKEELHVRTAKDISESIRRRDDCHSSP